MKIFKAAFFTAVLSCMVSCATMGLQSRIQKLSVGMSKQQVERTVGNKYEVLHSAMTPQGRTVEVLKYSDYVHSVYYEVELLDGTLVRYSRIYPREHHHD